jgi:hypothetical protein
MNEDIVPGLFCIDGTTLVRGICWYCDYWTCPDYFGEGGVKCDGLCGKHPGRHNAESTCDDWICQGVGKAVKP